MTPNSDAASARVQTWLSHIKALAVDIGGRLPTSEGEARASEYGRATLARLGLSPRTDEFASAGSVFRPHLAAAVMFLTAFGLYRLGPPITPWLALALSLFALYSEVMEITLRPHCLQALLPKRPSRNVYAVLEPRADRAGDGEPGPRAAAGVVRDLVLIGHVDTQRTPIIFSSPGWMLAYRLYSTLAFISFASQTVLYAGGAALHWPWAWPCSIVSAVMAHLLIFLTVQAEATPSTAGAGDNASGAGLVLTLAEDLTREPLARTRVWFLLSGCEEALHEGAKTFFARHKGEMNQPRAVVFEMLGGAGPAWLTQEGFVLALRPDPGLRRLAEKVADENPSLGAYAGAISGGVTEMSDARLAGAQAITIMGVTRRGEAPHWHRPSDTIDKLDSSPGGILERSYEFARAYLRALDAEGSV
jgi:hypothetical protein